MKPEEISDFVSGVLNEVFEGVKKKVWQRLFKRRVGGWRESLK